jgi:2,4-dienoyl-CoA reductase-like NADH-dependent reductase (Old Yellow Enzyme family)
MIHLGHLALSGAGMMMIEATAVVPEGRITPTDLGLWDDATEAALKPVLAAIRSIQRLQSLCSLRTQGARHRHAHLGKAAIRLRWLTAVG